MFCGVPVLLEIVFQCGPLPPPWKSNPTTSKLFASDWRNDSNLSSRQEFTSCGAANFQRITSSGTRYIGKSYIDGFLMSTERSCTKFWDKGSKHFAFPASQS